MCDSFAQKLYDITRYRDEKILELTLDKQNTCVSINNTRETNVAPMSYVRPAKRVLNINGLTDYNRFSSYSRPAKSLSIRAAHYIRSEVN